MEDQDVLKHFETSHYKIQGGRFVVHLPRRQDVSPLGESRSQAARRFVMLERSLIRKNNHTALDNVMKETIATPFLETIVARVLIHSTKNL